MKAFVVFLAAAVWAVTACSGSDSAAREGAAPAGGVDAAPAAAGNPADRDLAAAEARKEAKATAKPAVDTAQLREAPAWELADLNGKVVKSAEYSGKVIILNFWATWCGPCKMEIPDFKRLYDTYRDQGVEIIGVAMDREGKAKVAPFVTAAEINYPILLGARQIVTDYGPITAIPVTYVLSQDGKIYKRYIGARPGAVFEQDIKALLGIQG